MATARTASRSTRSPRLPRRLWKLISPSSESMSSTPPGPRMRLKSLVQTNSASSSRAVSTSLLPSSIICSPSTDFRFATTMKCVICPVLWLLAARYLWCVRMVVTRIFSGRLRNRSSIFPIIGTGHSTRPAISEQSSRSSTKSNPCPPAILRAVLKIVVSRSSGSRITKRSRSLVW